MLLLDNYTAVLLDMNGTFMFDCDRFDSDENYYATYLALGGRQLESETVTRVVTACFTSMLRDYENPECYEHFPSVRETLQRHCVAPAPELDFLERVFSHHEIGRVPAAYVDFLTMLARTHLLGIVSNQFSDPAPWRRHLADIGLLPIFRTAVFSSDGTTIKPSPALFRRALGELPLDSRVLFVGDSLTRDIIPAKALGLDTVWLAPHGSSHPAADAVTPLLTDLCLLSDNGSVALQEEDLE
jgi:FMN phosphatase YigB (HAD superfamily)